MTEEKFFEHIKEKTGWDFCDNSPEKAFGFIIGLCHPFIGISGFQSASHHSYFLIWKKENGAAMEAHIDCGPSEEMIEKVIKFLNTPIKRDGQGRTIILGEYDEIPKSE